MIGAKTFSEQYMLAQLIGMRLEEAGFAVEYRDGLGSAVVHEAVTSGAIDICIDYTGTLWTNQLKRTDNPGRDAMYRHHRRMGTRDQRHAGAGAAGFRKRLCLGHAARSRGGAGHRNTWTISPAPRPRLTIGGDVEFFERPEWIAVRDAYGLNFGRQRNFTTTFMYDALTGGEADVISAYTSDGRIAADKLVILEDPKGRFRPMTRWC